MSWKLPETPHLILTLGVAGLLSGLTIVGVYRATLPVIRANDARFLRQAVFEVVPGSETMQRLVWQGQGEGANGHLEPAAGVLGEEPSVYAAYTGEGRFVGFAIPAEGPGFQDTIRLLYGFDPERERIVGMAVLESRETPGLGDRIYKDQDFVGQFRDLAVEPAVELVKEAPTAPNQVDAITGATISSAAVVTIIGNGNELWLDRLPEAGDAPALAETAGDEGTPSDRGGPIPGGKS
jgi:electron transport complex protein RnfG